MKKRILKFQSGRGSGDAAGRVSDGDRVRRHLVADDCHDRADFWYCDLDDGQTGGL